MVSGPGQKELLSFQAVQRLEGISRATLYRRVNDGTYQAIPTGEVLSNGRPERKVPASCLENDIETTLSRKSEARSPARTQTKQNLPDHIPTTTSGLPDLEGMKLMGLRRQVRTYQRRMHALSRLEALLERAGWGDRRAVWERVATEFDVGVRTLERWRRRKRGWGWAGLVPSWGQGRGEYRKLPEALQAQMLDAYTYQGKLSPSDIWRDVVKPYCREHGLGLPHPRTVRRFLDREVPALVRDVAREGKRHYQEAHEPKVRRDLTALEPNEWWVSDHRQADTMVRVADGQGNGWPSGTRRKPCPCESGRERRDCCSVKRPWWTVAVDLASGALVGFRVSLQPDSTVICHMLKDAVLTFGLPEHWQRDRGKDFQAARLGESGGQPGQAAPGGLPAEVERSATWGQLGVTIHDTLPYQAWGKYVESAFSQFARRVENRLPGWTGSSPDGRPEKLRRELEQGTILTLEGYVRCMADAWRDWMEGRPIGDREKPPAGFYQAEGFEPRRVGEDTLAFLFQRRTDKKVRQGKLKVDGHEYTSEGLACHSDERVHVRWDRERPDHVLVWPDGGPWLAVPELPPAKYGEWGPANRIAKRVGKAQRAFVRDFASRVKGSCPRERIDKFGAHRKVEQQREQRLARQRAERRSLQTAQQAMRRKVEAEKEESDEPEREPYYKRSRYWPALKEIAG